MKKAADTAKTTMQSAMIVNTVVSIIISGPVQKLLESVKQLQIIVHLLLINVAFPAAAMIFMGMLMEVLTFQFYDFSGFYNKVFSLDPDSQGNQPFNDQFGMLGYNSHYIIQNFGTMCWTIFIAPLGWALAPLIVALCCGNYAYLKTKFNRMMFYNYWIGFSIETYFFLAMCAGINMNLFKWDNYGNGINSFLSAFFLLILTILPFFVGIFYTRKANLDKILSKDIEF